MMYIPTSLIFEVLKAMIFVILRAAIILIAWHLIPNCNWFLCIWKGASPSGIEGLGEAMHKTSCNTV